MYKKELASHFDAGVAIDSVFFENCDLPQPPDEGISCSENEWQCLNNVSSYSWRSRAPSNIIAKEFQTVIRTQLFIFRYASIANICVMEVMTVATLAMKIFNLKMLFVKTII